MTRQQLNGLRGRFLPIYRKAMAESGGDLWGHSPLDLAADNLPNVSLSQCKELILDLGLSSHDENKAYDRYRFGGPNYNRISTPDGV